MPKIYPLYPTGCPEIYINQMKTVYVRTRRNAVKNSFYAPSVIGRKSQFPYFPFFGTRSCNPITFFHFTLGNHIDKKIFGISAKANVTAYQPLFLFRGVIQDNTYNGYPQIISIFFFTISLILLRLNIKEIRENLAFKFMNVLFSHQLLHLSLKRTDY